MWGLRGLAPRNQTMAGCMNQRAHSGASGRPADVGWWDHGQCRESDVRHGVVPVLGQRDQQGEDTGAEENQRGHGSQKSKRRGNSGRREQIDAGRGDREANGPSDRDGRSRSDLWFNCVRGVRVCVSVVCMRVCFVALLFFAFEHARQTRVTRRVKPRDHWYRPGQQ